MGVGCGGDPNIVGTRSFRAMGAGRTPDMPGFADMMSADDVTASVTTVLLQPRSMRSISEMPSMHNNAPDFSTWHYTTSTPLSTVALREAMRTLPAAVYRCKGIVLTAEQPDERIVIQTVGRRSSLNTLGSWDGHPRRTDLVLIGATNSMDPAELQRTFDRCRVAPSASD